MSAGTASCIRVYKPSPSAALRLFCFPYAGASASAFQALALTLPAEIEVCGIEYPGRGTRAKEQLVSSMPQLVQEIAKRLEDYFDKPFAFLGYSMGALICYELARALMFHKRQPEHLFLAAAGAPRVTTPGSLSRLPDAKFLEEVKDLNGIPAEVARDPELLGRALPILRADFALCEAYQAKEEAPLRCPLTVLGGQNDPHVPLRAIEAWSSYAGSSFSSRLFPGGHFFLRTAQAAVAAALVAELGPLLQTPGTAHPGAPAARPDTGGRGTVPPAGDKRAALANLLKARMDSPAAYPLSLAQQTLWFEQQLDPANTASNVALLFQVRAELSPAGLTRALEILLDRHPMLRTVFVKAPGRDVAQQARAREPVKLLVRELPADRLQDAFAAVLDASRKQNSLPLDLEKGPLYRFEVIRVSASGFYFLASLPSILLDRWSVGILQREIREIYGALARQTDHGLAPLRSTYEQFVKGEQRKLEGASLPATAGYWTKRLLGAPPALKLPADHPRPWMQVYRGGSKALPLSLELAASLQSLGERRGASLFLVLLAAYYVFLFRLTGAWDLLVSATYPNREKPGFEEVLGSFARTVPLRADLAGDPTFAELLSRLRSTVLEDFKHAEIPLGKLAGVLPSVRGGGGHPSAQTGFYFQQTPVPKQHNEIPEPESVLLASGVNGFAKLDLSFDISGPIDGLHVLIEYNSDLFEARTIERMLAHYVDLLHAVAVNPDSRISGHGRIGERVVASLNTAQEAGPASPFGNNDSGGALALFRQARRVCRSFLPDAFASRLSEFRMPACLSSPASRSRRQAC